MKANKELMWLRGEFVIRAKIPKCENRKLRSKSIQRESAKSIRINAMLLTLDNITRPILGYIVLHSNKLGGELQSEEFLEDVSTDAALRNLINHFVRNHFTISMLSCRKYRALLPGFEPVTSKWFITMFVNDVESFPDELHNISRTWIIQFYRLLREKTGALRVAKNNLSREEPLIKLT